MDGAIMAMAANVTERRAGPRIESGARRRATPAARNASQGAVTPLSFANGASAAAAIAAASQRLPPCSLHVTYARTARSEKPAESSSVRPEIHPTDGAAARLTPQAAITQAPVARESRSRRATR